MKTNNYITLLFWVIITASFFAYTFNNQKVIDYEKCVKCDGNKYIKIYNYLNNTTANYEVKFPFNNRITVPFLAKIMSFEQPILGFHFVNLIFSILSVVLIFLLWTYLKIAPILKFMGLFWLIFHWTGMIRLNVFDPITVDLPLYLFHAALVYIIYSKRFYILPILAIVAVSQKESFTAYLIILLIYASLHNKLYEDYFPIKPILISVIVAIATKMIIVYFFPSNIETRGSFMAVLFYIKQIFMNPLSLIRWVIAIFTAYGALFLLSIQGLKKSFNFSPEFNLLTILTIISLTLGIIAGGDFTRIVFLGFPFVMTWILISVKEKPVILSLLASILSIPLMHLFETIPEPVYETLEHSWYPEFAQLNTVVLWGFYMIISYWILHKTAKYIS